MWGVLFQMNGVSVMCINIYWRGGPMAMCLPRYQEVQGSVIPRPRDQEEQC